MVQFLLDWVVHPVVSLGWTAIWKILMFIFWSLVFPILFLWGVWKYYGEKKLRAKVSEYNAKVPAFMRVSVIETVNGSPVQVVYKDRPVTVYKVGFLKKVWLLSVGVVVGALAMYATVKFGYL